MYSIIICTYNPDERILNKCLNSILEMDFTNIDVEIIIVDNNSTIPLAKQDYIQEFLKKSSTARIITEYKQGQTYARIAGIKEARGEWVIFYDDDNQPSPSYIQELQQLTIQFPYVGGWGPGNITVNFIDGIDPKGESYLRPIFQERHTQRIEFACSIQWQSFYPFGTGLCIKREILLNYATLIERQALTLIGRDATSLVSGEDTQIVLLAIKSGQAVGSAPTLQITHIIPEKRLTNAYIKRLVYGTHFCNCTSLLEVFPECLEELSKEQHRPSKFTRRVIRKYLKAILTNDRKSTLDLIRYLGYMSGSYFATRTPLPKPVKWITNHLKII